MRYILKLAHKSTAFFAKSIRNSYNSILKSYKSVTSVGFVDGIGVV